MTVSMTKRERRELETTPEWKAANKALMERLGPNENQDIILYDRYLPKNGWIHQAYKDWINEYEWDLGITLTFKDPTVKWGKAAEGLTLNHHSYTQDWTKVVDDYLLDDLMKAVWKKLDKKFFKGAVRRHNKRIQRVGFRQKQHPSGNPHIHLMVKLPDHITLEKFIFWLKRYWLGEHNLTGISEIKLLWNAEGWADYISTETRMKKGENTFCRWGTTITGPSGNNRTV